MDQIIEIAITVFILVVSSCVYVGMGWLPDAIWNWLWRKPK